VMPKKPKTVPQEVAPAPAPGPGPVPSSTVGKTVRPLIKTTTTGGTRAPGTNPASSQQSGLALLSMYPRYGGAEAPNGRRFPCKWGKPPTASASDVESGELVAIGDGRYGKGPLSLQAWVDANLTKDLADLQKGANKGQVKIFPKHWGKIPSPKEADEAKWVNWPLGLGRGAPDMLPWIKENINFDKAMKEYPFGVIKAFPDEWGKDWPNTPCPPGADLDKHYVKLPDNYGRGSKELKAWINAKRDEEKEQRV